MRLKLRQRGLAFEWFDCHVTAVVEEYMLLRAKQLYEEGKTIDGIKDHLGTICNSTNTLLIPDNLHHLKRGGRLTPMVAAIGSLLKIKPIL